jgi:hypothetical protein
MRNNMNRHLLLVLGACLAALGHGSNAQAQNLFTGPFGPGGTWNLYEVFGNGVGSGQNFYNAHQHALGSTRDGHQGYLASIHSAAENSYVHRIAGFGDVWVGLTDREGLAPGAFESQTTANNRTLGWAWTSGEPFIFNNWGGGEPNDFNGAEDAAHIRGDGLWNDNGAGAELGEGNPIFKYVIEYSYNSAAPVGAANFVFPATGPPIFPAGPMPGPGGGMGFFSALEVRGLGGVGNVREAVQKILSGDGQRFTADVPAVNHTDPQTNATAGMFNPKAPFLSNTGGDDNDIQALFKGRIRVEEAGHYTFGVQSDDGFALRIHGAQWISAHGAGILDANDLSGSTLAHPGPTGNSNTRGIVFLDRGLYDLELVSFENGGGAWWELFAAKGQFQNFGDTNTWRLVGHVAAPTPPRDIVLTGPATVVTKALGPAPGNFPAYRDATRAIYSKVLNMQSLDAGEFAGTRADINLYDPQAGRCCAVPIVNPAHTFPNDTGGNDDNYISGVFGSFNVATPGEYTFWLFGDDGVQLHIKNASFTSAQSHTGDGPGTLQDVDGDLALTADFWTGNTNTSGVITLGAGTYDFEAFHFEGGGDSHLQIWFASGNRLGSFNQQNFYLLSTSGQLNPADINGLQLVPEPSSIALACLGALGLVVGSRLRRRVR